MTAYPIFLNDRSIGGARSRRWKAENGRQGEISSSESFIVIGCWSLTREGGEILLPGPGSYAAPGAEASVGESRWRFCRLADKSLETAFFCHGLNPLGFQAVGIDSFRFHEKGVKGRES
jgi:hypothetical protein